ncbi:hypothetical protein HN51_049462 [Arachis hypogaea]
MKESLSWPEKGGREGRDGGAVHHRRVCCFGLAQPHTPFILVSESVPFSPILTPFVKLIGIGAVMERLELLMLQLHLRCSRGSCCHCLGTNSMLFLSMAFKNDHTIAINLQSSSLNY